VVAGRRRVRWRLPDPTLRSAAGPAPGVIGERSGSRPPPPAPPGRPPGRAPAALGPGRWPAAARAGPAVAGGASFRPPQVHQRGQQRRPDQERVQTGRPGGPPVRSPTPRPLPATGSVCTWSHVSYRPEVRKFRLRRRWPSPPTTRISPSRSSP